MTLDHAKALIARGGGMITKPGHLGVMVAQPEHDINCPAGWLFIDVTEVTPELLVKFVGEFGRRWGRGSWPRKE